MGPSIPMEISHAIPLPEVFGKLLGKGVPLLVVPGESPILFIPNDLILISLVMNDDGLSMSLCDYPELSIISGKKNQGNPLFKIRHFIPVNTTKSSDHSCAYLGVPQS